MCWNIHQDCKQKERFRESVTGRKEGFKNNIKIQAGEKPSKKKGQKHETSERRHHI